jgi:hypothetical protein
MVANRRDFHQDSLRSFSNYWLYESDEPKKRLYPSFTGLYRATQRNNGRNSVGELSGVFG